jgi:hypothetical protein
MYYAIGAGNLYRVTKMDVLWPNPVRGHGAYYVPKGGNRFNGPDQLTVCCMEDPVAALAESANSACTCAIAEFLIMCYSLPSTQTTLATAVCPNHPTSSACRIDIRAKVKQRDQE